jgi:small GTP-binding protein
MDPADQPFKIVMVGEAGTGKSCLVLRYTVGGFCETYMPTIGVDFMMKHIEIGGFTVKSQIWDTGGSEKYLSITKAYFRAADGIVLVFDLSCQRSFDAKEKWITLIHENCADPDDIDIILVGNKCDKKPVVRTEDAEAFAESKQIPYFETSALNGANVDTAFVALATAVLRRKQANGVVMQTPVMAVENEGQRPGGRGCDC